MTSLCVNAVHVAKNLTTSYLIVARQLIGAIYLYVQVKFFLSKKIILFRTRTFNMLFCQFNPVHPKCVTFKIRLTEFIFHALHT